MFACFIEERKLMHKEMRKDYFDRLAEEYENQGFRAVGKYFGDLYQKAKTTLKQTPERSNLYNTEIDPIEKSPRGRSAQPKIIIQSIASSTNSDPALSNVVKQELPKPEEEGQKPAKHASQNSFFGIFSGFTQRGRGHQKSASISESVEQKKSLLDDLFGVPETSKPAKPNSLHLSPSTTNMDDFNPRAQTTPPGSQKSASQDSLSANTLLTPQPYQSNPSPSYGAFPAQPYMSNPLVDTSTLFQPYQSNPNTDLFSNFPATPYKSNDPQQDIFSTMLAQSSNAPEENESGLRIMKQPKLVPKASATPAFNIDVYPEKKLESIPENSEVDFFFPNPN